MQQQEEAIPNAETEKIEEKDILGPSLDQEYTTSFTYDPTGNVRSVQDKEGKTTWYEYDALNRLQKECKGEAVTFLADKQTYTGIVYQTLDPLFRE